MTETKLMNVPKKTTTRSLMGFAAVATLGAIAVPLAAQGDELSMLSALTKGEWVVRERGSENVRRICVRSGMELIQIRHKQRGCNRFVVEDGTKQVTVQYSCSGNGYGRTNIRRESPTLVQISSQGIAGSLPFELTAEARRVGSCK